MNQLFRSPGDAIQSVAASSFDSWIKFNRRHAHSSNSTVNFYLRGRLQTDFATSFKRSGSKWITGLKNAKNSLIHDGLVKKYGVDVWDISTV